VILTNIYTAPGTGNIVKQDGSRQFAAKRPTSSLWALQPGLNQDGVQITDPGANTQVILAFQQAYLMP
jgi:hypothetical protein